MAHAIDLLPLTLGPPCAKMPSRGSESMACEPCGALFAKEAYGGMLKHHKPIWRENTHTQTIHQGTDRACSNLENIHPQA